MPPEFTHATYNLPDKRKISGACATLTGFLLLDQDYLYSCIFRNLSVFLEPSSLCTQLPPAKPLITEMCASSAAGLRVSS